MAMNAAACLICLQGDQDINVSQMCISQEAMQ
jgi:hypothetical protein